MVTVGFVVEGASDKKLIESEAFRTWMWDDCGLEVLDPVVALSIGCLDAIHSSFAYKVMNCPIPSWTRRKYMAPWSIRSAGLKTKWKRIMHRVFASLM